MDRKIGEVPYPDLDDVAADGVYFVSDDSVPNYNIRKAIEFRKKLKLNPWEPLPDEYMDMCRF